MRPEVHVPRWESVLDEVPQAPTILLVDAADINRRLLKAILKTGTYRILEATRPSAALAILEKEKVDLVIVDLAMPEMNGPDFCRLLRRNQNTQLIPIVMTTSVLSADDEIAGIESGADDFLVKPLRPALVRTRVRSMLRNKALVDSLEQAETILFALAQSVEHRDRSTGMHCERLAAYSLALGQALGLSKHDQVALYRGGYLHDIGKVGMPDVILFKRGLLTEQEWEVMRQHTIRGEEICRPMRSLAPVLPIIRSHHERWDGTGYPDGLRGEEIPLLARILQVADIYDALTTARPYKPAFSRSHAVQIMLEESQRGWRDPELIPLFAQVVTEMAGAETAGVATPSDIHASEMHASLENMRRELIK
jgi:putative two-component system response regulator